MEKNLTMLTDFYEFTMLFDFYGELLTDKQKELFDLYYNEDLSLTEIAENAGITRQGVRDAITRSESILRETEDRLGLVKKYSGLEDKIAQIADAAGYISRINANLRNYEIAVCTEKILKLTGELK